MEPTRKLRKPGLEHFLKVVRDLPDLTPRELYDELTARGYRGQAAGRRALCLMAYRHVRRVKRLYLDGVDRHELSPKSNYLIVGPTGCGKTHIIELLFGSILKLPTAQVDVTTYSETGYVGQDPSTIITRLLQAADENPMLASIGVICLDEFDKVASGQNNAVFAGAGTTKDVTGMGVQRELLKMLEASEVVVPLELSHSSYGDNVVLSTADIPFVAAGAFSGLKQLTRHRNARDRIGFGREQGPAAASDGIAIQLSEQEVESVANFQAYGFLPELVARFSRVIPFSPLSADTLKEILHADVVERMTREFRLEGFELRIADEVMDFVVHDALRRETGARGLSSVLSRHLEEVAFEGFGSEREGVVNVRLRDGAIDVALDT